MHWPFSKQLITHGKNTLILDVPAWKGSCFADYQHMHPLGQAVFLLVTSIPVLKPSQLLLGVLIDGVGNTGSQACSNKGKQEAGPVKRRWSQGEAGRGGADNQAVRGRNGTAGPEFLANHPHGASSVSTASLLWSLSPELWSPQLLRWVLVLSMLFHLAFWTETGWRVQEVSSHIFWLWPHPKKFFQGKEILLVLASVLFAAWGFYLVVWHTCAGGS